MEEIFEQSLRIIEDYKLFWITNKNIWPNVTFGLQDDERSLYNL